VTEQEEAEAWVRAGLEQARAAHQQRPPGSGDASLSEYEAQLRRTAAGVLRPVAQYVGGTVEQAHALAPQECDRLCVHRGATGHRASWRADRVHLEVGHGGLVTSAHRDPAPWRRRP
jgi:hypothetical protein